MKGSGQGIPGSRRIEFQKRRLPGQMNVQKTEYIDFQQGRKFCSLG
jgi:hypothetical protein